MAYQSCNTVVFTIAGIIVGTATGAVGAIFIGRRLNNNPDKKDAKKVYKWLKKNTSEQTYIWCSTSAIASGTNLTEERVRMICSTNPEIRQSLGVDKNKWGIREFVEKES